MSIPRPLLPLFLLLLLGNVLDAMFTYIGVGRWGLDAELNVLPHWLMTTIGPLAGLVVAKSWATICAVVVAQVSKRKGSRYGKRAFLAMCAAVYFLAVLPWLFFLVSRL